MSGRRERNRDGSFAEGFASERVTVMAATPQVMEVEKHIIGAAMLAYGTDAGVDEALALLQPEDFYLDRHILIWKAMRALRAAKLPSDIIILAEALKKAGEFQAAGGEPYLMEIATEVVSSANIEEHAKLVKEKSLLRQAIAGAGRIQQLAYGGADPKEVLAELEKVTMQLAEQKFTQGLRSFRELLPATLKQTEKMMLGEVTGVPTGLADLDRVTGGLQPTDFIILAGRPAMGKTGLGLTVGWRAAKYHKKRVAFFSLEMSAEQLQQRALCAYRNIDLHKLRTGKLEQSEFARVTEAIQELADIPLYIDDASHKTPMQMLSQARRMALQGGLDLIIMDYCQLGSADEETESRQQEVAAVARGCKAMAKDLKIPVVGLAQLHREVEKRTTKEPILSDLRETGELEQAADIVGFIHRPHYYDPSQEETFAKLILAKYRNGPTGMIPIRFNKESASFSDYVNNGFNEGEAYGPPGKRNAAGSQRGGGNSHRSAPPARHPSDPGPQQEPGPARPPRPGEAGYD